MVTFEMYDVCYSYRNRVEMYDVCRNRGRRGREANERNEVGVASCCWTWSKLLDSWTMDSSEFEAERKTEYLLF